MRRTPEDVLQQHFGYSAFRNSQREVIEATLGGKDSLVVMATGGGKSLCYQVPPLVLQRPAVVISPLISLMEDQVMALKAKGLSACFLGSAQLDQGVVQDAWAGRCQFVYMTPELASYQSDRLCALHASVGLAVVAVDEAHCISEWGFDFRTEYRNLYRLREALPDVPFLALTATATPQVREDVIRNLRLKPDCHRWLMSFERPNLHFEARKKAPSLLANFEELLGAAAGGQLEEPTIVYTLTKRETQDLAAALGAQPGLAGRVGCYHGDMSQAERKRVHHAFLCDELLVVVATVAFGMGIDKGNVRRVLHYGAPASLEAYYQQAGRAGRDGLQSRCTLLWSTADVAKNAMIKSIGGPTSAAASSQRDEGSNQIFAYVHAAGCRHASMVEYFDPGSWQPQPNSSCRGGCDNCAARQAGTTTQRDVGAEARLLVGVVARLREMGLGTSVDILRGSRAQKIQPWMHDITSPDGIKLHGAGAHRSADWWKALAGLLIGHGLLASRTKSVGPRSVPVIGCTEQGAALLQGAPQPLVLQLSGEMLSQERAAAAAAEAAARAAASAAAAAESADAVRQEEQQLFRRLQDLRKGLAASAGVAPTQLLSDFALWEVARKRPDTPAHLRSCEGCSAALIAQHGQALVEAVAAFCAGSQVLTAGIQWQQAGHGSRAGAAGGSAGWPPRRGSSGGAEAAAVAGAGAACSEAAACLSEPKNAALEAYQRFTQQGEELEVIATTGRARIITPMTVAGYLADAANSGMPLDWERAAVQAGLTHVLAHSISQAVLAHGHEGLGGVKRGMPTAEYGQIKLVAAMMNTQAGWLVSGQGAAAVEAAGQATTSALPAAEGQPQVQEEQPSKRVRVDSPAAAATPLSQQTLREWLQLEGPATGPQLTAQFCGSGGPGPQQLAAMLEEMCANFEVVRRGGDAARSSSVDLEDTAVRFLLL